jgi:hypothetical protein
MINKWSRRKSRLQKERKNIKRNLKINQGQGNEITLRLMMRSSKKEHSM